MHNHCPIKNSLVLLCEFWKLSTQTFNIQVFDRKCCFSDWVGQTGTEVAE
jgi:hypothetical protein